MHHRPPPLYPPPHSPHMKNIRRRISFIDETAQTMSEYSVLVGFIAIVVVAAFPSIGSGLMAMYNAVAVKFGG